MWNVPHWQNNGVLHEMKMGRLPAALAQVSSPIRSLIRRFEVHVGMCLVSSSLNALLCRMLRLMYWRKASLCSWASDKYRSPFSTLLLDGRLLLQYTTQGQLLDKRSVVSEGPKFAAGETPQYLRGSEGMPPQENFEDQAFRDWIWAIFWAVVQTT